jgi:hypothetical protein
MTPNERCIADVRRWIKSFPLEIVLSRIDDTFAKYGDWKDHCMTSESWNCAFEKIPAYCRSKIKYGEGPEVDDLLYVQGIVRNRIGNRYFKCLDQIKAMRDAGFSIESIKRIARTLDDESDFEAWVYQWLTERAE